MDFSEEQRYQDGTYPKLRQVFEAKKKLIQKRNHPAMVHRVRSFENVNFMEFSDIKFDVIVLKIPLMNDKWGIDQMLNTIRLDFISESPSFVVLGCGSSI
jgi:hypothetical protein